MLVIAMILSMMSVTAFADDSTQYTDRKGVQFTVPANAFATSVVSFTQGSPWTTREDAMNPNDALGAPDRVSGEDTNALTLGAGGQLVLGFDIQIVDGEGDDIYVFEVGPSVEATKIEVSNDLSTWYEVGTASGSTAGVDLNGKIPAGERFKYVRLTDLNSDPNGTWPGADIDAVAGLNVKPGSSNWAYNEMDRADEYDLIPDMLINKDYTQPITRLEFAAVAVKTYENISNTEAIPATVNPFTDCSDTEMLKAYNTGIAVGTSATTFDPDTLITREQAAAMLTRVFKRATMPNWTIAKDAEYPLTFDMPAPFSDDAYISDYARESVYFMAANNIIAGIGNNTFAPRNTNSQEEAMHYANATREQALAIAVRMVENLK